MSASSRDIFVDKSSSISHANSGNSAVVEPLLALPRFFSTGFWLLCLALILKVFFAGGDMQSVVITLIPLQLFWAFGVNRLSQITADKFGTSRPLSESMIVLLTAVSLFCVPRLDDYPLSLYRIDPFFWLWMAVQLGVPFVLFLRLKQETLRMQNKKANAFTYLQPAVMSLFANMYLSVLFFLPAPAMFTMIFLPGWAMCQLGVLAIYNFLLRDAFAADLKMVKAIKSKIKQASLLSQDYPVIMDYKAFGGLRRWLSERFSSSANIDSASKSKNSQIMVATMIAPILLLATFIAVFNYFTIRIIRSAAIQQYTVSRKCNAYIGTRH